MIEALVAYIEAKGFEVAVLPGRLIIHKEIGDLHWSFGWAISRLELAQRRSKESFFAEADHCMEQLRQAALVQGKP